MAKSNNHKMALLYMMRELLQKTDEDHSMNASDLIAALAAYDCERTAGPYTAMWRSCRILAST
jgi:hypothetical protein